MHNDKCVPLRLYYFQPLNLIQDARFILALIFGGLIFSLLPDLVTFA